MCEKKVDGYQYSRMDGSVFDIWPPHWQSLKPILKGRKKHEDRAFIFRENMCASVLFKIIEMRPKFPKSHCVIVE